MAVFRDWSVFAEGFVMTIAISVLALALALLLGILFGVLGTAKWKPFRLLNRIYVEAIQNTPLVIQVFFLYHGLPHLGIMLPVFSVGMLGVGVYHGAYIAEVVRAGIQAIPRGQHEAAYSQGFSYWEAMRYIVLPQAKRMSYPPLTNQAVSLIKNTSVMAMVAGGDLMYHADSWASTNLYYGPAYVVTGLLYIAICFPLATYARRLERKLEVSL
nr:amino acid ABC transporter permease [Dendrosporobacter quercicolus]